MESFEKIDARSLTAVESVRCPILAFDPQKIREDNDQKLKGPAQLFLKGLVFLTYELYHFYVVYVHVCHCVFIVNLFIVSSHILSAFACIC